VPEWQDILCPALETYATPHNKALAQLERAQQVAFYSEPIFLQSTHSGKKNHDNIKKFFHQMISKQLERLAPLFEHNLWVMRSILLRPFVFCQAIAEPPPFVNADLSSNAEDPIDENMEFNINIDDTDTGCGKEDEKLQATQSIHDDNDNGTGADHCQQLTFYLVDTLAY
jgi:hypothetical protein